MLSARVLTDTSTIKACCDSPETALRYSLCLIHLKASSIRQHR